MSGRDERELEFETLAIHAGGPLNATPALTPPIFQSTTFKLRDLEHGAELARAIAPAEFYTRWGNPTTRILEATVAALEGAEAALAFSSGMAALSTAFLSLLEAGDHAIVGRSIYSGVHELAVRILPRYGVEVDLADMRDLEGLERAMRPRTRLIALESPTNPTLELADLEAVARIARAHGALTLADNTFATPWNQRPLDYGIDIVAHAATKALGGHSDVTAGVLCARRDLVERFWKHQKIFGGVLSPFEAWLLLRGLKTLALRVERQNRTALELARFLEGRAEVARVHYPGLPSHPQHELAKRSLRGFGGILSFELRGGLEGARRFTAALELITLAVSLGGVETLIQHPASMSHGMLREEELKAAGIAPGLLRLSVGLEAPGDLRRDLERAFKAV